MTKKLEMGKWYEITGYAYKELKKIQEEVSDFDKLRGRLPDRARQTRWVEVPFEKPVMAMYIGVRNVWDVFAWIEYDYDYSIPASWWENKRLKQHRVYLFVLNAKQKPIRVFPHQVVGLNQTVSDDTGKAEPKDA